jgi:hypothetical protein
MSGRKIDIIEYDDETIVEIKIDGRWYRYKFVSWDEAVETVSSLNPEKD